MHLLSLITFTNHVGRTGGVVGTGVQQHDIPWLCLAKVVEKALMVQAPGLRLVVLVDGLLHTSVLPDAAQTHPNLQFRLTKNFTLSNHMLTNLLCTKQVCRSCLL